MKHMYILLEVHLRGLPLARNGKVTVLRHLCVPHELLEQVVLFLSANMPRKMGLPAVKDSQKSVKKRRN